MFSLKALWNSLWIILLTLFMWGVWIEAYHAYMMNHTYYYDMMSGWSNWQLIIGFSLIALLPLWVLFQKRVFTLKALGISTILMIIIWWFFHVVMKWGLVWTTWFVMFLINIILLLTIITIFLWGLYVWGAWVYKRYVKHTITSWADMMLAIGIGLWIFLLLNYILIFTQLFFPILARMQFAWFIRLLWSQRSVWKETSAIVWWTIESLRESELSYKVIILSLLLLTCLYILFSFNLSFIPYSTAWDANHAYMYFPKVWSLNNGLFFSEGPIMTPHLWMVYIAYWFSLFKPFGTSFIISPDTLAVVMNNISWWLALFFGLGSLSTIITYFKEKNIITTDTQWQYAMSLWWMYFLLWLMSGMGAFLVFVDNKTDLWVMSLTMLAIMSGFLFIKSITHKNLETFSRRISENIPALLSGSFFALAVLSKPTAFQDVIIFFLFLIGTFIGIFGVIGIFFLVLAVLGKAEAMSMVFYVSKNLATKLGLIWLISSATQIMISRKNRLWQIFKPILYRGLSIVILLFTIKGTYLTTYHLINNSFSFSTIIKGVLLSDNTSTSTSSNTKNSYQKRIAFVADTGESDNLITSWNTTTQPMQNGWTSLPDLKPNQCTISSAWLTQDSLYTNLEEIEWGWLIEDLWRYIWFGQRVFSHPKTRTTAEQNSYGPFARWYHLLKVFFHTPGCYSLNTTADKLCENPTAGQSVQGIQSIVNTIDTGSNQYKFLQGIMEDYKELSKETDPTRQSSLSWEIAKRITTYVTSNVVQVTKDKQWYTSIAIPYAFLTPFNVVFNWSLQNLSSYYTDIGFIWILSFILLIAGTISSIYNKQKELVVLHLVTLAGWIIWRFLASGIIWYAVGIIAWTTFSNALFLSQLLIKKATPISSRAWKIVVGILILAALIQTLFNLTRIASQWWSGPFVRYKWSTGKEVQFLFSAQGFWQQEVIQYNYNAQDVFNLQFGHYNAFINYVKTRKDDDGVLIAGTYLQYFLDNQNNIISDGLLTNLRQWWSDENTCNLNLRLQDKKIKYLVIDPNIWSVVQGEGNSSLFDRFMAKIDTTTNTIIEHGTMTMLVKMIEDGYLKLINTNNMGAKYAYTLSDQELLAHITSISDPQLQSYLTQSFQSDATLFRAKMAVPRFFNKEAQYYFTLIGNIFQSRLGKVDGISDMADILGKQVDSINVSKALSLVNSSQGKVNLADLNKELSNDERTVLGYYLAIQSRSKANDAKWTQEIINQLLQSSLAGGSQLITFERVQ